MNAYEGRLQTHNEMHGPLCRRNRGLPTYARLATSTRFDLSTLFLFLSFFFSLFFFSFLLFPFFCSSVSAPPSVPVIRHWTLQCYAQVWICTSRCSKAGLRTRGHCVDADGIKHGTGAARQTCTYLCSLLTSHSPPCLGLCLFASLPLCLSTSFVSGLPLAWACPVVATLALALLLSPGSSSIPLPPLFLHLALSAVLLLTSALFRGRVCSVHVPLVCWYSSICTG